MDIHDLQWIEQLETSKGVFKKLDVKYKTTESFLVEGPDPFGCKIHKHRCTFFLPFNQVAKAMIVPGIGSVVVTKPEYEVEYETRDGLPYVAPPKK